MKLFIICLLFPFLSFSQTSTHKVFGVDLNKSWIELTNYQKLTYYLADNEAKKNNIPYVMTDIEFYRKNIDADFLELGFDEILVGFPRGEQSNLKQLTPQVLIARFNFTDTSTYKKNHLYKVNKTFKYLQNYFGEADLNQVKESYLLYNWNRLTYEVYLTSRLEDLSIILMYVIKNK